MSSEQNHVVSDGIVSVVNNSNQPSATDEVSDSEDDLVVLTSPSEYYSPRSPLPSTAPVFPEAALMENGFVLDSGEQSDDEVSIEEILDPLFQENIEACLQAQGCLHKTVEIVKNYKTTRRKLKGIEQTLRAARKKTRAVCDKLKSLKNDFLNKELCRYSDYIGCVLKLPSDGKNFATHESQPQPTLRSTIQCRICYETTNDNIHYGLVPCGHTLCTNCFNRNSLHARIACPICQTRVTSDLKLFF